MVKNKKQKLLAPIIAGLCALISVVFSTYTGLFAAITTPTTINYQGRLLNSSNNPLSGNYTFRFSIWNSADWQAADTLGSGSINVASVRYAGWQETHTVTTGAFGLFNMSLGSTVALPNFTAGTHTNLQVEVKQTGQPDTSYEILDPAGNLTDTNDRKPINDQAYAENADTVDNADVGTSAGDLATLSAGGTWTPSQIPGGTDADNFVVDNNNSALGDIGLQFGNLLAKILKYSQANNWFDFNDNVNIQGNLSLTGTVDGVDISNLQFTDIGIRTKEIVFEAEYESYVIEPDGTNNRGKMVLDFIDSGGANKRNFYEWSTRQATLQDMDIVLSFQLPLDFSSFTGSPLIVNYQASNGVTATNRLDVSLFDTTGTAVGLTGGSNLANGAWSTANITFGGAPTFTAGSTVTLHLKLSSTNAGWARVSDIAFNYNGR